MKKETMRKNVLALFVMIMISLTVAKPVLAAEFGSNTLDSAIPIEIGPIIENSFPDESTIHYYKFTVPSSGEVYVKGSFDVSGLSYCMYDVYGASLRSYTSSNNSINDSFSLNKGTYYFSVQTVYKSKYAGAYRFGLQLEDAHESFPENYGGSDNSKYDANVVSLNTGYNGFLPRNDGEDWYKFTIPSSGQYEFIFTAPYYQKVYIYNDSNKQLWSNEDLWYWDEDLNYRKIWELNAGTYYLKVSVDSQYNSYSFAVNGHNHKWENSSVTKATPDKNGSISQKCSCGAKNTTTIYAPSSVQLTRESFSYTGKSQKPGVVVSDSNGGIVDTSSYTVTYDSDTISVGMHNVKITFKGNYSGSVTKSYSIDAKATGISKLKGSKKGFTVKMKKLSDKAATGYQIQYSTNSSFKSAKTKTTNKTSVSVKKLKGKKTYYVRVRSYKIADGKTYYSAWSAAKKVKTK